MKIKSKKLLVFICCVLFALSVCGMCLTYKPFSAVATTTDPLTDFSMKEGASVRIGLNDNKYGIQYAFTMSEGSYNSVKESYTDVTFGILIAPNDWNDIKELNADNVFGENAVYCFATFNEQTGDWVAPENSENKSQIINFTTDELTENIEDGKLGFIGSMVNLLEGNLTREFRGVAYISYTEDGITKYVFKNDDSTVRSMTYVAMLTLESNTSNLAPVHREYLQSNYIDKVADENTNYSVEYYKQNDSGDYVKDQSATETKQAKVAAEVTAVPKAYDGYVLNVENSKLTAKAYPNDKLTLSVYYDKIVASADTIMSGKKGKTDLTLESLLLTQAQRDAFSVLDGIEGCSIKWYLGDTELTDTDTTDVEGVNDVKALLCVGGTENVILYSAKVNFYNSETKTYIVNNGVSNITCSDSNVTLSMPATGQLQLNTSSSFTGSPIILTITLPHTYAYLTGVSVADVWTSGSTGAYVCIGETYSASECFIGGVVGWNAWVAQGSYQATSENIEAAGYNSSGNQVSITFNLPASSQVILANLTFTYEVVIVPTETKTYTVNNGVSNVTCSDSNVTVSMPTGAEGQLFLQGSFTGAPITLTFTLPENYYILTGVSVGNVWMNGGVTLYAYAGETDNQSACFVGGAYAWNNGWINASFSANSDHIAAAGYNGSGNQVSITIKPNGGDQVVLLNLAFTYEVAI